MPGQPFPGAVPPKKSSGGKIALIIGGIALVLLCLCGVGVVWAINQAGDKIEEQIDALPSLAPTLPADTPTAGNGEDFNRGDCLVNDGTDTDPALRKVACGAGTFEVLAVIPFTTDDKQCDNDILGAGKGKYDQTYTYDHPDVTGDYVLCLKQR